jgi:hypothetical protein
MAARTHKERTMKHLHLSLLALVTLAAPAVAQTNLYNPHNVTANCVPNPYAQRGYAPDQPVPTTEFRPALYDSYAVRYSIAQAHVGGAGTERAYLNISNLEPVPQQVAVLFTVKGKACTYRWEGTVPPEGVSLGLHADPTFAGQWDFSVVVYFSLPGGDVDLTNYDTRQVETFTKAGKLVPRS